MIQVLDVGDAISVRAPYYPEFVGRARELGGRWDRRTRTWKFPRIAADVVREACREHYGTDGGASDYTTIELTALRDVSAGQLSVGIAYVELAKLHASYRTGARVADGVTLISGSVCGSSTRDHRGVRRHVTTIDAGTRFRVRVPHAVLARVDSADWAVRTES